MDTHETREKELRESFVCVIQLFLSPMFLFERRLKYLLRSLICDEFTRGFVGLPVSFLSYIVAFFSLFFVVVVSIGSGERQQSGRLRGGFVEDRNERIQWGKRPRLLIKTDIVFFSLSL